MSTSKFLDTRFAKWLVIANAMVPAALLVWDAEHHDLGINEVNFAILNTFDYQFAPRYKDIYDTVRSSLYGFQHPSQYPADWPIRPVRKLRKRLVIDEWDNIQRIMVSLALKTTTQSLIIRKLSSHARRNKTQRALWEYDHIFHSRYLLDYLDLPELRRNVQYALNRGENYHLATRQS